MDLQGRQPSGECRRRRIRKLKDPEERSRIARVFERGLTEPSGFVLAGAALAGAGGRWRRAGAVEKWKTAARARSSSRRATARSAIACRSGPCRYVPPSRISLYPSRPIRARSAVLCPIRSRNRVQPGHAMRRRPRSVHRVRSSAGACRAGTRRNRRRSAHGHCGRAARRAALRVHAAGRARWRIISNWSRAAEAAAQRNGCRSKSRAMRRRTIRASMSSAWRPDPGVIEVNIHPGLLLARMRGDDRERSMRRRGRAGSAPTSS